MAISPQKSTTDGLPEQFVSSLRLLFDILDEEGCGYVKLSDIENRWDETAVQGLPAGVVEALRKVAPPNGSLTFERFIGGLKIAMLRNRNDRGLFPSNIPSASGSATTRGPVAHVENRKLDRDVYDSVPPSVTKLSVQTKSAGPNTATVHPNNAALQRYDRTMQQMPESVRNYQQGIHKSGDSARGMNTRSPPKVAPHRAPPTSVTIPISAAVKENCYLPKQQRRPASTSAFPRQQNDLAYNDQHAITDSLRNLEREKVSNASSWNRDIFNSRRPGDGRSSVASASALEHYGPRSEEFHGSREAGIVGASQGNARSKRAEPRRHTLTSGVDYNMIKRMKQLEQERDLLLQGLEAVNRAHEWYQQQLQSVQEKQKLIGKGASPSEYSLNSYQERINLQMSRLFEVNQQLRALIETSEKGFPQHMNLAVSNNPPRHTHRLHPNLPAGTDASSQLQERDAVISRLRSHNKMLTQEVGHKADRIEQLEREKAQIIKEMFVNGTKQSNNAYEYDDTTFI